MMGKYLQTIRELKRKKEPNITEQEILDIHECYFINRLIK